MHDSIGQRKISLSKLKAGSLPFSWTLKYKTVKMLSGWLNFNEISFPALIHLPHTATTTTTT